MSALSATGWWCFRSWAKKTVRHPAAAQFAVKAVAGGEGGTEAGSGSTVGL